MEKEEVKDGEIIVMRTKLALPWHRKQDREIGPERQACQLNEQELHQCIRVKRQ